MQQNSDYNPIERKTCRVCNSENLSLILSLGDQYVVNFLEDDSEDSFKSPLDLMLCNKEKGGCGLLQLKHTIPAKFLYKQFWYMSGVNQTMKLALADITKKAQNYVSLKPGDIVVDVGANDGTLLRMYDRNDISLVGFEPATNLIEEAKIKTTKIINDFFNAKIFKQEFPNKKAKVITTIAMFYDLEDPNKFVKDIIEILDDEGIWIIQMNYLTTMLENNAFDNIVHEHLEYYSLNSLEHLLERHGLEIFDCELNDVNGGSIRTYIKHSKCGKFAKKSRVDEQLQYEEKIGLNTEKPYHQFADRIENLKSQTFSYIQSEVNKGKKVFVYGASTRGNTLLQYYGLNNKLIEAAADRNPIKWGKKIVGTLIPIISEDQARMIKPDYFLILPWYFLEEFKEREREYLESGGKFIVPLPKFQIID